MLKKLFRLSKTNGGINNQGIQAIVSAMNEPCLVEPAKGSQLLNLHMQALTSRDGGEPVEVVKGTYNDGQTFMGVDVVGKNKDIAVINISGGITNAYIAPSCGVYTPSHEGIARDFKTLMADSDIKTIVTVLDSPGGVASQNFDLSDMIYSYRGKKRMIALVSDMACSGAYSIASAHDEIWITQTSVVGSVGVASMHVEQSKALKEAGIKVTYVYSGKHKVEGNPHEELSEHALKEMQQRSAKLYDGFVKVVSRNLGLTYQQVADTEAGVFVGEDAISNGFAHKIGNIHDLREELFTSAGNGTTETIEAPQAEEPEKVEAPQAEESEKVEAPQAEEPEKVEAPQAEEVELKTGLTDDEIALRASILSVTYDSSDFVKEIATNAGISLETVQAMADNGIYDKTTSIDTTARTPSENVSGWGQAFKKVKRI